MSRIQALYQLILNTHQPDYLAPDIDKKIRDNFNILLDC